MNFNEYQEKARFTAIYGAKNRIIYPTLGLAGEAGEVCEKIKKALRDAEGKIDNIRAHEIKLELGDVLWYIANLAEDLNITLDDIAEENIKKLRLRQEEDKLHGEGDNR